MQRFVPIEDLFKGRPFDGQINEPVLRFEVRPAGEMPSYPIDEIPTPVKGWTFIQSRITDTGSYDQYNKSYLDFWKDAVEANAGSSNFVWDGDTAAHIIRGKGVQTPPDTNFGHFHENMVELWIVLEGQLDFLIEGEPLITGTVGDVVQAPNERWHRATSRAPGTATRLAITPRNKEAGSRTRKEARISDSSERSSSHT